MQLFILLLISTNFYTNNPLINYWWYQSMLYCVYLYQSQESKKITLKQSNCLLLCVLHIKCYVCIGFTRWTENEKLGISHANMHWSYSQHLFPNKKISKILKERRKCSTYKCWYKQYNVPLTNDDINNISNVVLQVRV